MHNEITTRRFSYRERKREKWSRRRKKKRDERESEEEKVRTWCDGGVRDDDGAVRRGDIVQFVVIAGAAQRDARFVRAGNFDRRALQNDFFAVRIVLVILNDDELRREKRKIFN